MTNATPPIPSLPEPLTAPARSDVIHWDLLATVRRVIRARWTILLCALLGALIAGVLAYLVHPYYTANAVFLPPRSSDLAVAAATPSLSSLVNGENSDVYLGMLTSRSVADDVIDHLGLMNEFKTEKQEDARFVLSSMSKFAVSKNALISVTITAGKPALAAAIANAYLDALFRLSGQMAASGSKYRRIFFEQQLQEQKKVLNDAESALRQTQESTGVVLPQGEAQAGLNATAQLQSQIGEAEARLAGLLTSSTEQNPQVITARSQLAQLRSQLARQQAAASGPGIVSNRRLPQLSLEYAQKARDVRLNESEYDALVQQYERARIASIDPGPQLQVVDRAVVPGRKAGPSRRKMIAIGFVLGFFLGLFYILAANPLRRLIRALRTPAPGTL